MREGSASGDCAREGEGRGRGGCVSEGKGVSGGESVIYRDREKRSEVPWYQKRGRMRGRVRDGGRVRGGVGVKRR